jgi:hypothetical protein
MLHPSFPDYNTGVDIVNDECRPVNAMPLSILVMPSLIVSHRPVPTPFEEINSTADSDGVATVFLNSRTHPGLMRNL